MKQEEGWPEDINTASRKAIFNYLKTQTKDNEAILNKAIDEILKIRHESVKGITTIEELANNPNIPKKYLSALSEKYEIFGYTQAGAEEILLVEDEKPAEEKISSAELGGIAPAAESPERDRALLFSANRPVSKHKDATPPPPPSSKPKAGI